MEKIINRKFFIALIIILTLISLLYIIAKGKTYTLKIDVNDSISDISELDIKIEQETPVVKCTEKSLEDGILKLEFKSIKEGKAYVSIENVNYCTYEQLYVHKSGVLTCGSFFGDTTGGRILPISVMILIAYLLFVLIRKYRNNLKHNMYEYQNIAYLGLIIFLSFAFINQIFTIINYKGMIQTISRIIGLCSTFSLLLLPFAFVTAVLVTISNIILVKKEGLNLKNLLGLLSGVFFCFVTILPELLNNILQTATWIDVHNEQGIALYIQEFIETAVYILVSYLECILLGTMLLAIKSAKHIPEFNKDYMIILGCKVRNDGTLTNLLKGRVDRAIEFCKMQKEKTGKELVFVPSGGKGSDEIVAEAQAMKNYLIQNGIKENNILIEDKSKNTYENIKFSNSIIKEKKESPQIAFSTTNYHVFRAGAIANVQNINIEGIGAKTKTYFWVNAFIREFIATLYSERKKYLSFFSLLLVNFIFMIVLVYLSNVL